MRLLNQLSDLRSKYVFVQPKVVIKDRYNVDAILVRGIATIGSPPPGRDDDLRYVLNVALFDTDEEARVWCDMNGLEVVPEAQVRKIVALGGGSDGSLRTLQ